MANASSYIDKRFSRETMLAVAAAQQQRTTKILKITQKTTELLNGETVSLLAKCATCGNIILSDNSTVPTKLLKDKSMLKSLPTTLCRKCMPKP